MQIIWNLEAAESLKQSHTLFELETFETEKGPLTAWCVVEADKLLPDLAQLENLKQLHSAFLQAYKNNDFKLCQDCAEHLMGRFGGELDTFYQEILSRHK
jgi:hypothetical protein